MNFNDFDGDFDGYTSSAAATPPDDTNLTFAKWSELLASLDKPTRYYATTSFMLRGDFAEVKENAFNPIMGPTPDYLVCHPDDLESLERGLSSYCTLVLLSEFKPTQEQLDAFQSERMEKLRDDMTSEMTKKLFESRKDMNEFKVRKR